MLKSIQPRTSNEKNIRRSHLGFRLHIAQSQHRSDLRNLPSRFLESIPIQVQEGCWEDLGHCISQGKSQVQRVLLPSKNDSEVIPGKCLCIQDWLRHHKFPQWLSSHRHKQKRMSWCHLLYMDPELEMFTASQALIYILNRIHPKKRHYCLRNFLLQTRSDHHKSHHKQMGWQYYIPSKIQQHRDNIHHLDLYFHHRILLHSQSQVSRSHKEKYR